LTCFNLREAFDGLGIRPGEERARKTVVSRASSGYNQGGGLEGRLQTEQAQYATHEANGGSGGRGKRRRNLEAPLIGQTSVDRQSPESDPGPDRTSASNSNRICSSSPFGRATPCGFVHRVYSVYKPLTSAPSGSLSFLSAPGPTFAWRCNHSDVLYTEFTRYTNHLRPPRLALSRPAVLPIVPFGAGVHLRLRLRGSPTTARWLRSSMKPPCRCAHLVHEITRRRFSGSVELKGVDW
jgi:hypothetical protein